MGPTLQGLLGLSYNNPFFGVDLRRVPEGGRLIAMAHNFSVAFGNREHQEQVSHPVLSRADEAQPYRHRSPRCVPRPDPGSLCAHTARMAIPA